MVSVKSKPDSRVNPDLRTPLRIDIPRPIGNFEIDEGSCTGWIATSKLIEVIYESTQTNILYWIANIGFTEEEVTEVRDIPINQIKKEMLSLLSDGKTRYVDEIAEELNLDFMDVMEAFNQLQEEEKLFIDDNKL